jgi:hypothetical protein
LIPCCNRASIAAYHMREIDEDPSPEDIERFSDETAYCRDCGAEIWDAAEVCPKCFAYLGGDTAVRTPLQEWFRKRWMLLVIIVLIILMVMSLTLI